MTTTKVRTCQATACAFNEEKACRAWAVTIDDPNPATCGTYAPRTGLTGGQKTIVANVGACKAAGCAHNEGLMCTAGEVAIGMAEGKVACLTYKAR